MFDFGGQLGTVLLRRIADFGLQTVDSEFSATSFDGHCRSALALYDTLTSNANQTMFDCVNKNVDWKVVSGVPVGTNEAGGVFDGYGGGRRRPDDATFFAEAITGFPAEQPVRKT
jgi:hypothetical protein